MFGQGVRSLRYAGPRGNAGCSCICRSWVSSCVVCRGNSVLMAVGTMVVIVWRGHSGSRSVEVRENR
ncbi:hypothetical protein BDF14DRAFT_1809280 [Spinellus fusiger]|nr:hypothetical protein BDF14DRAFT_1809280 [Spinellus fusiger]